MSAARPLVASKLLPLLLASGVVMIVAGMSAVSAAPPARPAVAVRMPPPTWPWRQTLAREIAVQPTVPPATAATAPRPEPLSPLLVHAAPPTDDMITLPPLHVSGSRLEEQVQREYALAKQRAHDEAVLRRLGTGMHMLGRSHFGVLTVFYIPVFVGFGWSW